MAIIHLTYHPKIMISVSEMTVVNPFILAIDHKVTWKRDTVSVSPATISPGFDVITTLTNNAHFVIS